MDIIPVIVLGVVEGITEFLPISSTGHLILAGHLLGVAGDGFASTFTIAIQLGAILAVPTLFWKDLTGSRGTVVRIAVAFIPTAVIGLVLYPFVKRWLGSPALVLWALAVGGIVMILLERTLFRGHAGVDDIAKLSYRDAALIGVAQAVSMVPGVSRAAATVFGGLFTGLSRVAAVRFSFLLALPTMAAATGLDIVRSRDALGDGRIWLLLSGALIAWATASVAMRWLLRYLQHHDFKAFGVYRIVLAVVFWLLVY